MPDNGDEFASASSIPPVAHKSPIEASVHEERARAEYYARKCHKLRKRLSKASAYEQQGQENYDALERLCESLKKERDLAITQCAELDANLQRNVNPERPCQECLQILSEPIETVARSETEGQRASQQLVHGGKTVPESFHARELKAEVQSETKITAPFEHTSLQVENKKLRDEVAELHERVRQQHLHIDELSRGVVSMIGPLSSATSRERELADVKEELSYATHRIDILTAQLGVFKISFFPTGENQILKWSSYPLKLPGERIRLIELRKMQTRLKQGERRQEQDQSRETGQSATDRANIPRGGAYKKEQVKQEDYDIEERKDLGAKQVRQKQIEQKEEAHDAELACVVDETRIERKAHAEKEARAAQEARKEEACKEEARRAKARREKAHLAEENRIAVLTEMWKRKNGIRAFARVSGEKRRSERPICMNFPDITSNKRLLVFGSGDIDGGQIPQQFEFDRVFDPDCADTAVVEDILKLVDIAVACRDNMCVFCYGQTGTGKTYTMTDSENAIVPSVVRLLLDLQQRSYLRGGGDEGHHWKLSLSAVQVHDNKISDLLGDVSKPLEFTHCTKDDMQIPQLTGAIWGPFISEAGAILTLNNAMSRRKTTGTNANAASSRSHVIYRIRVVVGTGSTSESLVTSAIQEQETIINLVDLAGSEPFDASASGAISREGNYIRTSLLNLGTVLRIISTKGGYRKASFRSDKLTMLLQSSLNSGSNTLMLVTLSPFAVHATETLRTLKFAKSICANSESSRSRTSTPALRSRTATPIPTRIPATTSTKTAT